MKIYASIKSALAVISYAGMAIVSSQAFAGAAHRVHGK